MQTIKTRHNKHEIIKSESKIGHMQKWGHKRNNSSQMGNSAVISSLKNISGDSLSKTAFQYHPKQGGNVGLVSKFSRISC